MHRLPSDHIINKFRFAALLVVLSFLSVPAFIWLLFCGIFVDKDWFFWAGGALLFFLFCIVTKFLIGSRLKCPLCMMPPLANRGCARNRAAKRIFGSYKLVVAGSILFKDSFRCPYCGEPTMMEARRRGGG